MVVFASMVCTLHLRDPGLVHVTVMDLKGLILNISSLLGGYPKAWGPGCCLPQREERQAPWHGMVVGSQTGGPWRTQACKEKPKERTDSKVYKIMKSFERKRS